MPDDFDTLFTMPAVDHPALTEIGVILAGLPTERLLAGLGAARHGDDPTATTLLVDLLRHGDGTAMANATAIGARRWRSVRPALALVDTAPAASASIRQSWQRALRTVLAADLGAVVGTGAAGHAYLAACWLRRTEIDSAVQELESSARHPAIRA